MGRKLLAVLLSATLTCGMLVGCGKEQAKSNSESEVTSNAESQKEDASKKNEEPASIRLVQFGAAGDRNTEFFENEFHDRVLEELNIDVKVEFLAWGTEEQVGTMLASGEKFAFYCATTRQQFGTWGTKGYFATMDEAMFEEYAPAYLEARMGHGFECAKFGNDIVLIPVSATSRSGHLDNISIRNDLLNEVGWDVSDIETYDDYIAAIKAVQEKYPDMKAFRGANHMAKVLNSVIAPDGAVFQNNLMSPICVVDYGDPDSDEVISWLESDYFANLTKIMEDWYAMGFIDTDVIIDYTVYENAWTSGNCISTAGSIDNIYDHQISTVEEEVDVQYLSLNDRPTVLMKDYDWAWGISAAEQDNVESYLKFFNWMYESKENYMYCLYGVEGIDYTIAEDGAIEVISTDSFFPAWMHRTLYYEPLSEEIYDAEEIAEFMAIDDNAIVAKDIGFSFNSSAVEVEEAALNVIISEKVDPIAYGFGNYEKDFPAVLEELKAAGLDKYVAEYQRQFSEFMANK